MKKEFKLKRLIRDYLNMNDFDVSKADDLIDECEAEQTFAELKDGSSEMITENTYGEVSNRLHKNGIN